MPSGIIFGVHLKASAVKAGASVDGDARNALPETIEAAEGLEYSSRWIAPLDRF